MSNKSITAQKMWLDSGGNKPLADIARELGIHPNTVYKWKSRNKWTLDGLQPKPKMGAPKGNRNAVLNKGGKPPRGNKNGVVTGQFESILLDTLTDEERSMVRFIQLNKLLVLREELMLLTIRERRMMQRIADLQKKSPTGMGVVKMTKSEGIKPTRYGEPFNESESVTEIMPVLHTIQRIEEALTKVQARKQLVVDQIHRIENDDRTYELNVKRLELETIKAENASIIPAVDGVDDGFLEALSEKAIKVWADEDADEDQ